mgnify:CR=1 FL=1
MRLDHLLSKEHHETQGRPADRGVADFGRFVGWAGPVVGAGSGATTDVLCGGDAGSGNSSDTLLGFETTSPQSQASGLGSVLSPRLWWWGVVFDSWIVVASI